MNIEKYIQRIANSDETIYCLDKRALELVAGNPSGKYFSAVFYLDSVSTVIESENHKEFIRKYRLVLSYEVFKKIIEIRKNR